VLASGAFDGWESSLIGGIVGAIAVVIGVWLTQKYFERNRHRDARRDSVAQLIPQIANLRDAATRSKERYTGNYALWGLRQELYLANGTMRGSPALASTNEFYEAVSSLRTHVRAYSKRYVGENLPVECQNALSAYMNSIDEWAALVIDDLTEAVEAPERKAQSKPHLARLPD
jgi:hypothetical protein